MICNRHWSLLDFIPGCLKLLLQIILRHDALLLLDHMLFLQIVDLTLLLFKLLKLLVQLASLVTHLPVKSIKFIYAVCPLTIELGINTHVFLVEAGDLALVLV